MKLVELPCYCASLRQASRSATVLYQEAMGTSGLQITQYTLLQAIADIPNLTTTELSQAVGMDQTTATRMLTLIKRRGRVFAHIGAAETSPLMRFGALSGSGAALTSTP